jgi:hypothetical protein
MKIAKPVAYRIESRAFAFLAFDGARLAPTWPLGDGVGGSGAEQFGPGTSRNPRMILRLFRPMARVTELVSVGAGS